MTAPSSVSGSDTTWLGITKTLVITGSDSVADWVRELRTTGVRRAAPTLILVLERLRRSDSSSSRLISALRLFKAPVLKTCAALPKPWESAIQGQETRGLTLEQRLYLLMVQNLLQALHQLDRSHFALDARRARRRNWVVRNLFRFFDRQMRYAALWRAPLPSKTWRDLHDLYVYLMVRRAQGGAGGQGGTPSCLGVDAAFEYKQLLLFGIIARLTSVGVRNGALMDGLGRWARQSVLKDGEALDENRGQFLVELSEDSPPRQDTGVMSAGLHGWVLIPPAEFLEQLDLAIKGENR